MKIGIKVGVGKNSTYWQALAIDMGYTVKLLTFDIATISEITELPVRSIREMSTEGFHPLGTVSFGG